MKNSVKTRRPCRSRQPGQTRRRVVETKDAIAGIAAGSSAFAILVFLSMRRNAKRRAAGAQQIIASQGGLPQGAHGHGYQPHVVRVAPDAPSKAHTVDDVALQRANSSARQAARKDAVDRQKQRIDRQLRK